MITTRLFATAGTMLLMLLVLSSPALAHGVEGTVHPGGLAVACRYSTGEVMDYAKVKVFAPGSSQPFQVGNADKNGRFCFYPDSPGEWRVTAEDGMGHRLEVKVPVTDLDSVIKNLPTTGAGTVADSKILRVLTGLSALFGISGFFFWLKGKKLNKAAKNLKANSSPDSP
ncbi:MAG: hypothetical protein KJ822_01500 [Proteobacteria bacterium]|nr:hypothetical protein [Pseudomonadota bacterium]